MRISAFMENIGQAARDAKIPMQDLLAVLKKEGLESVYAGYQYSLKQNESMVMGLLNAFHLPLEGLWATIDFNTLSEEEARNAYREMIDCAARNNAKHILITPGNFHPYGSSDNVTMKEVEEREDEIKRMIYFVKEAKEYGEKAGVTVTMEDYDVFRSPIVFPEVFRRFFKEIPGLKCTFDTGNFIPCDDDVLKEFEYYKDSIVAMHLKDRIEDDDQNGKERTPYITLSGRKYYPASVGHGDMHIKEIIGKLNEIGYDGCGIIELFSSSDMANKLIESIRWMKENTK